MASGAMKRLLLLAGAKSPAALTPMDVDAFEESVRLDERERLGVESAAEVKRLRRHARLGSAVDRLVQHYKRYKVGFFYGGWTVGPESRVGKPSYMRAVHKAEGEADAAEYWENRQKEADSA